MLFQTRKHLWTDSPVGAPAITPEWRAALTRYDDALVILWSLTRHRWEVCERTAAGQMEPVMPLEYHGRFVPPGAWMFDYLDNQSLRARGVDAYLDALEAQEERERAAREQHLDAEMTDEEHYRAAGVARELQDLDPTKAGVFAVKPGG